ncbi:hypothetical protein CXP39_03475 [Mesoplasma syrphidae]|uniref:Nucleoside 2-deoxyribosyltransferase n=1 Tax=Mesoplasma syrphidae TaxID=225999 RepID=A0A2K9C6B2_9MOLU|nr:hypothetical protein [Mesoplasma syrphidae]AUF83827.1 hypothetical protein CXP39_03475 [Mesoplasma syrphidae]
MKQIYNAGSMFNEAQVNQRRLEGKKLREAFPNFVISNPIDFDTNLGNCPTPLEIWDADYKCVQDSQYIIFELDSLDHGMIMEFAIAIEQAKATQNEKVLIPVISDFRYHQKSSTKQLNEFSINHFVFGAIFDTQLNSENRLWLAKSHSEAIEMIKNYEKFLDTHNKEYLEKNAKLDCKFIYANGAMYF